MTWRKRGEEGQPPDIPQQSQAHLWAAGRVASDLGVGAIAILHCVLGLHQLLCFLNHLAPEPSDALSGREPGSEGPGAIYSSWAQAATSTTSWGRGLGQGTLTL